MQASESCDAASGKDAFVTIVNSLFDALGRKRLPPLGMRAWRLALRELTEQQLLYAMNQYMMYRSNEWPTPSMLLELSGVQLSDDVQAAEAWNAARSAVSLVGSYASPEFSDPIISRVIHHFGGWVQFCELNPAEMTRFTRPQFVKIYKSYLAQRGSGHAVEMKNLCQTKEYIRVDAGYAQPIRFTGVHQQ